MVVIDSSSYLLQLNFDFVIYTFVVVVDDVVVDDDTAVDAVDAVADSVDIAVCWDIDIVVENVFAGIDVAVVVAVVVVADAVEHFGRKALNDSYYDYQYYHHYSPLVMQYQLHPSQFHYYNHP